MTKLATIKLKYNKIDTVDEGTFAGLSIYFNLLTTLGGNTFIPMTKLKTLTLKYNEIDTVEKGAFAGLLDLENLDFSKTNTY